MSIPFPGTQFFHALRDAMEHDPGATESLGPCEAYCGFAIDHSLYVFEFDGRQCVAVVVGGNELDLDFVIAGPTAVWQKVVEALKESGSQDEATLPILVERGELEVRSTDDDGVELARAALPFLQIFLEHARSFAVTMPTDVGSTQGAEQVSPSS